MAFQVQARDLEGAEQSIFHLVEYICNNQSSDNFDEIKLRIIQVLTIASRSAYNAGGNPNNLFRINLYFIKKMLMIRSKTELLSLAKNILKKLISIIPEKNITNKAKINTALQYIREHCTSNVSRNVVSDILGCSPSHLSRLFSEITGHTFKEFVLKYRMEKAKELLHNVHLNIIEVAYEVGYNDPNYFTSAFKRTFGITPSLFKKSIPIKPD